APSGCGVGALNPLQTCAMARGLELSQITTYACAVTSGPVRRTDEGGPQRVTMPVVQVLDLLLSEPARDDWFALEICRRTRLGSGSVVEILFRLQKWGWVTSRWEDAAEAHRRGPPRGHFDRVTGPGGAATPATMRERVPGPA